MNKRYREKQPVLRNKWFYQKDYYITQLVKFSNENNQGNKKNTQKILEEKRLWPAKKFNLSYPKPKCFNCQVIVKYKIV